MELTKAHFQVGEDTVQLSMPFAKVDQEKRTVSGWATLDSVDTQGDVVTAGASKAAFEQFRGNVRFQHRADTPAGKILKFEEKPFYHAEQDQWYNGIYVDVYVSKGAQNVWEMVLDGTLTGFSIGGAATDMESEFVKNKDGNGGRTVRFVKAYSLTELSLVDSPANPMASITSFQKMFTFNKAEDGVTEVYAEEVTPQMFVHYCNTDSTAISSEVEVEKCNICSTEMEVIGSFQSLNEGREEKIAGIVRKFLAPADDEGGVQNMAEHDVTVNNAKGTTTDENGDVVAGESKAVEVNEVVAPVEETKEVEAESKDEEKAEAVEEDKESDDDKLAKVLSSFKEDITNVVKEVGETNAEQVATLSKKLETVTETFEDKLNGLQKELDATNDKFAGIEKSLTALEDGTAVKKSSDLGGSEEKFEKSNKTKSESEWGGRFFSLERL